MRIVIAGCGYVGGALASALARDGHEVWGIRRDVARLPEGVEPLACDLSRRATTLVLPDGVDVAVYCVGADGPSEKAYRTAYLDGLERFLRALGDQGERPRRVFFTSSTSVYAQQRGEWIDEASPASPARPNGEILILAERLLLSGGLPATVLRLGGIYGPGRTRLIESVRAGKALRRAEPHYTNRIHRDDAAGALRHLIGLEAPADLYLGVDDEPAEEGDVLAWLAARMGAPPPRLAGPGDPPVVRRGGSKRCRNARLRATGYEFRYPSFREGYGALLGSGPEARLG